MNQRTKLAITGALAGLALLASGCSTPDSDFKTKKILRDYYIAAIISEGYTNYAAISKTSLEDVSAKIEEEEITQEDLRRAYIFKYGKPPSEDSN